MALFLIDFLNKYFHFLTIELIMPHQFHVRTITYHQGIPQSTNWKSPLWKSSDIWTTNVRIGLGPLYHWPNGESTNAVNWRIQDTSKEINNNDPQLCALPRPPHPFKGTLPVEKNLEFITLFYYLVQRLVAYLDFGRPSIIISTVGANQNHWVVSNIINTMSSRQDKSFIYDNSTTNMCIQLITQANQIGKASFWCWHPTLGMT